jgi:DNA-binding transcriptional LysR family regulator
MWELTPIISQLYLGMGIHSELHETETELIQGLENDVYRVIILLHPLEDKDSTGNPLYISTPFIQENLALLVSKTHRLARKKSLFLKDLAGEKLLIHNKIGFWYQVCKTKIPNALFLEQNDLAALSEIANASALPTFVTNMSDRIGIQPSEKLAIPILDKEVNVQFWCICKASKKKDYAALLNAIALVQR